MFDIAATEILVIVIVAVIVIGPKDMPKAMRAAGRWIGKLRRVSAHFRTGIDAMVREAELEDMERKWKAQNEEIMRRSAISSEATHGEPLMTGPPPIEKDADGARETGATGDGAPLHDGAPSADDPVSDPAPAADPARRSGSGE